MVCCLSFWKIFCIHVYDYHMLAALVLYEVITCTAENDLPISDANVKEASVIIGPTLLVTNMYCLLFPFEYYSIFNPLPVSSIYSPWKVVCCFVLWKMQWCVFPLYLISVLPYIICSLCILKHNFLCIMLSLILHFDIFTGWTVLEVKDLPNLAEGKTLSLDCAGSHPSYIASKTVSLRL